MRGVGKQNGPPGLPRGDIRNSNGEGNWRTSQKTQGVRDETDGRENEGVREQGRDS